MLVWVSIQVDQAHFTAIILMIRLYAWEVWGKVWICVLISAQNESMIQSQLSPMCFLRVTDNDAKPKQNNQIQCDRAIIMCDISSGFG